MKSGVFLIPLILIFFISSCEFLESNNRKSSSKIYTDSVHLALVAGSFIENSTIAVDSLLIRDFFNLYPELNQYKVEIFEFYRKRSFELAWHDSTGKIEAFQILFNQVMQMEENGLNEQIHYLEDFKRFANKEKNDSTDFVDLMQTAQYFHFAGHVLGGLSENELQLQEWHIPKIKKNYTDLLEKFISGEKDAFDKSLYPQYQLLRKALVQLREIQQNGGWIIVPFTGSPLRLAQHNLVLRDIKKRLKVSGEFQENDSSDLFSIELDRAVRQFQKTHGLYTDGIIGNHTIEAMNISVEERIKQIMVNMERCRWLPIKTDKEYVLVNIPAFSLQVMSEDSLVFECEAIVGKETNKTAIFKGLMKHIVFNPYWNIPDQIAEKEIIPAIARNKDYLKENHMEWYEGRLRQVPGPDNALGAIKFVFPNPFDIFLHDTPAKGLFKEQKRAFSHGCIRISAPLQLAAYLLSGQKGWSSQKMNEILSRSKEYYVKLEREVPVYILYLTAFVDPEGKLNFREDIYQKDASLARMLIKN
jgi:murein L,D-transpeptidase YcbB/YkuD